MEDTSADRHWTLDEPCGAVNLGGRRGTLWLRSHAHTEEFTSHTDAREFVPLSVTQGRRIVMLVHFYTAEADLMPSHLRPPRIGDASAYYYQADAIVLLWRCNLLPRYRHADPACDEALRLLWERFEALLHSQFPAARQMLTPTWNRPYAQALWRAFIEARGFTRPSPAGLPGAAQIKDSVLPSGLGS